MSMVNCKILLKAIMFLHNHRQWDVHIFRLWTVKRYVSILYTVTYHSVLEVLNNVHVKAFHTRIFLV